MAEEPLQEADARYFEDIEAELDRALTLAERARAGGGDPSPEVEIPVATDMADRVENLLDIPGVADRVRALETDHSREEAALALVEDFVDGSVGADESRAGKIEGAVRTAVALLTEGVVAAPIEGIDRVELLENDDGSEFVNVYYAGPIRSAGGTAQALSVLVADYARSLLGIDEFQPRQDEIGRYAEEVALYDDDTGLQYSPSEAEVRYIAEHCPIMLDGEATGGEEVSGHRDLERVDTNAPRGGMCLVLAEGIALKAPKLQRYVNEIDAVDWPWLQAIIDGEYAAEDDDVDDGPEEGGDSTGTIGPPRVEPQDKYLRDLIAGRPVFSHPSEAGGFRLRYGRARNHGFATAGVHPATMHIVDDFLAAGTQLKTERPGKAAGVVPVDSIEGPTVRLATGEVRRIDDPAEAQELANGVVSIIDLGEYLVNVGEFVENNHELAPAGYTVEWWRQEFAAAGGPVRALEDRADVDLGDPDPARALEWATDYEAPLHPAYTYCWHDVSVAAVESLANAIANGEVLAADGAALETRSGLVVPRGDVVTETLETLLVPHTRRDDDVLVPDWQPLVRTLGFDIVDGRPDRIKGSQAISTAAREYDHGENAIEAVNDLAPFRVRERAPTRIGARMGRPEKSEVRELSPAVHTLFPIGEAGGAQRDVAAAAGQGDNLDGTKGRVEVEVGRRSCRECEAETYRSQCPECGGRTRAVHRCPDCDREVEPDKAGRVVCPRCEVQARLTHRTTVDVGAEFETALSAVGERESAFEMLKGVKGLTSAAKVPEPLEKGILRAKHGVSAFKDGTVRYDMTDLPVTAVRPSELDIAVDHLRALGYHEDIHGDPLEHDDQLVELRVQDVVLSAGAAEHLQRTADFVDDLLESYYDLEPYYTIEERDDLVGELVFGMAPHTSAAVVGRVVGFTDAAVGYAHPYFHAAKRRNCFHPETNLWYRDELGSWHHEQIRDFVEDRLEDPRTDDFGTLVQDLDGSVFVPSVTKEGDPTLQSVEAVSKHESPDTLVRVRTRNGRELTVTPDHQMRRWSGKLESVRAHTLQPGDELPAPRSIDEGDTVEFDLLREFLACDSVPNDELVIRGIGECRLKRLLGDETSGEGYCKPTADIRQSMVYDWISRDEVPASALIRLVGEPDLIEAIPADVRLAVPGERATVDRFLTVDDSFASLLGYYAAAGYTRQVSDATDQTTVCPPDEKARKHVASVYANALGVETEGCERPVTVSSRLVAALFDEVLNTGSQAETKRVPDAVFSGPDSVASSFLAAYFSDGNSTTTARGQLRTYPVSDELTDGIIALLKRFGIVATDNDSTADETDQHAEVDDASLRVLELSSVDVVRFAERVGSREDRARASQQRTIDRVHIQSQKAHGDGGAVRLDEVVEVEYVESDTDHTYCLTVEDTHTLVANDLFVGQCDGDEDCVMLLLDGLLNFSETYLPDKRGGRMDAPLVMSSRIDPAEIDDEAHNIDVVDGYSRSFYEATRERADPEDVGVELAATSVGTADQYRGFNHTHDTTDIAGGPELSAYKTLGTMEDKTQSQLELARRLRAVDEADVAERVIEYHFLPDLIGNLRAFSRQETRCHDCGTSYRRMPLTGECRECGGDVHLTVHEGSVTKYLETAKRVAAEYGARDYTVQRLEILERSIDRLFENDRNKQSGIADFM